MTKFGNPRTHLPSISFDIDHPDRYAGKDGDLLEGFERYILTKEEMVGAYKFNIIKYTRRCLDKNGIEDLEKAKVYIDRFIQYLKEEEVHS